MYSVFVNDNFIFGTGIYSRPLYTIIEPLLSLGKNTIGSFTFGVYPNHPLFDSINGFGDTIQIRKNNKVIFKGRFLGIKSGFYNEKQVTCESVLGYLLDSVQRPYDFMSGDNHTTPEELFRYFIAQHNTQTGGDESRKFKVGRITVTDPNDYIVRAESSYMSTWDSLQEKLLRSSLGGIVNVRYEDDGNYIDYLASSEAVNSQKIEFGKNLIDFKRTENADELATVIIPVGSEDNVTIEPLNDEQTDDICKTGDYIYSKKGMEKYGSIVKTVYFDEENPVFLLGSAKKYLANVLSPIESIEITAADLSAVNMEIESFDVGQMVGVVSEPHDISREFEITSIEIYLMSPSKNKLILGAAEDAITSRQSGTGGSSYGYASGGAVYTAGTGLEFYGNTINHKNSITAGTVGDYADGSLRNGDTLQIPVVGYDSEGHISKVGTRCLTLEVCHTHPQVTPSKVWVILHNMNKYPSVTVLSDEGELIICGITYTNENTVTLTFSEETSGTAYLN